MADLNQAPNQTPPPGDAQAAGGGAPPIQSTSPPPPPSAAGPSTGLPPVVSGSSAAPVSSPAGTTPSLLSTQSPAAQALAQQQQPGAGNDLQQRYDAAQAELARLQPLARIGYQTWQQQQQAPQQTPAAPPKAANPFGLPEFDHHLLQFIKRDGNGDLVVTPGAPPDTLARYQAYTDKFQTVQRQFWNDPMQFLGDAVKKVAQEVAQQQMQQGLGGYQEQVQARTILDRNAEWLYAKDGQGNRQFQTDALTGQTAPVLSPYGQAYAKFVREAADMGIQRADQQDRYATTMLQNALHNARAQQAAGQQQGQQAAGQFIQNAAQQATQPNPSVNVNVPPPAQPMTLRERMQQQFQANGINDATLRMGAA